MTVSEELFLLRHYPELTVFFPSLTLTPCPGFNCVVNKTSLSLSYWVMLLLGAVLFGQSLSFTLV